MAKVTRIENGVKLSNLPVNDFDLYDSEAHAVMLGIAEAYGFAPKVVGLMILARSTHGKYALVAEHDELYFCVEEEGDPPDEKIAMLDEYGWHWDEDMGWSCFT
jgi:hypothetical protein